MKRMVILLIIIIGIVYAGFTIKWSKLFSHGVLSSAHQELEESGECGACHTPGEKLDNDKCLFCHQEVKALIEENIGYHARVPRECAHCHSEHHGASYSLVHLDIESFDHAETGWPLNEKHAQLKCIACHAEDSYLLDKTRCINCHFDVHLGQLGDRCDQCHGEESFKVIAYQHKESEKSPKGKHLDLLCHDCHTMEYAEYPSEKGLAIRYKGVDFTCNRCHEDPHDGEYGKDCSECHEQDTFEME